MATSDPVSGRDAGLHRDHIVPDAPQSLAAALAELQQHLPRIGKDSEAEVETKTGRRYRYNYAGLTAVNEALLPLLNARGFAFTCGPTMLDGQFVLDWVLWHAPSGEKIEGFYPLPSSAPQTMGGAITYARRYAILAVTGAAPDEDDDDAQAAEQAARSPAGTREQAADKAWEQYRVQRNQPPETRDDGSATDAELIRMDRGHEPSAWRATSTAENDPWYQPTPIVLPEDQPGTSLKEQRQSIYIALGKHGIKDHRGAIERLTRRDIAEPRDMSYNEAVSVLARVRSWDGRTEELLAPLAAERSQADA